MPLVSESPLWQCAEAGDLLHQGVQRHGWLSTKFFSNEWALLIRWPKYYSFSFSISPFSEYSGLISFRIDWFALLAVQGTIQESSPTPQFKSISSLLLSFFYCPTLTLIHDYWKNHSFDYMDFVGKVMSLPFNMLSRLVIAFLPRKKLLLGIIIMKID